MCFVFLQLIYIYFSPSKNANHVFCFMNEWFQGPTEKEQIDVQGDISYDIVEFITDTWPDVTYSFPISPLHCYMLS